MKRNSLFKSSVFFSWIVSYVILMVITLMITSTVYFVAINVIEGNINKLNGTMLKQLQVNVDTALNNAESLAFQVAQNSNVNSIMYEIMGNNSPNKYTNVKVIKDFNSYTSTSNFINNFFVYFNGNNTVYTPASLYDSLTFYKIGEYTNNSEYETWKNFLINEHNREIIPFVRRNLDGADIKTVAYVQSIPIAGPVAGNIAIVLNEDLLIDAIQNIQWVNRGIAFIIDKNNNILASTESFDLPDSINYNSLLEPDEFSRQTIKGEEVIVSHISSGNTAWKYVSLIPVDSYMGQLTKIRRLTGLAAALCLIVGGIVAYYFSRRNYIHINELINILKKDSSAPYEASRKTNELNFIKKAIANNLDEKKLISKKLEEQKSVLRRDFLTKLLKGKLGSQISVNDLMMSSDVIFISDEFAVILFNIEDSSSFFTSSDDVENADQLLLAQFIIRNVVEELADRVHRGYVVEVDEFVACIVNFSDKDNESNAKDVLQIIHEAQEFIQTKFSIYLTISVSSQHRTLTGIHVAYGEAIEAMEYKMVLGSCEIIKYEDIKTPKSVYYYPLEVEQQLMNYIKIGDFNALKELLGLIFEKNFSQSSQSLQTAKCLMFNLISTMIKTMDALNIMNDQTLMDDINPVEALVKCETIIDMKAKMIKILAKICKYIDGRKQSSNIQLRDEIIEYVTEHYTDVNLNVTMLSDVFKINPLYLSRFFKEQNGESLVDFINKTRLKKAKQLLKEQKSNVEDIASKVGFTNIVSFFRVFKKYEGITPGKYRDI